VTSPSFSSKAASASAGRTLDCREGKSQYTRLAISAWVKNLADKYYRVYNLDLSALGCSQGVYVRRGPSVEPSRTDTDGVASRKTR
jgi:hypothetical protein